MGFDVNKYYSDAWTGEKCNDASIISYIQSYKHIILWGASYQGTAIGKKLIEYNVKIEKYWDLRYEEIKICNGIEVCRPFQFDDPEHTLVILCIGNRVIHTRLINRLKDAGCLHYLHGDYLYMGLLCPFSQKTGINARRCSTTMECRQVYCKRIQGILSKEVKSENPLMLPSITLIINQRCSLKCKFCTSYMNEYGLDERIDFPLERICGDIDAFFSAVDLVGTITVMGGEPFMHPDLSKIIGHLCEKKNFGLISIATSGTFPIKEEQLENLSDSRVNISFSNYLESINDKQKEVYYKNIEIVKNKGICYTTGLFSPEWVIPPTLYDKGLSEKEKMEWKSRCVHWHQVKNGKVHPCDFANSIYSLGVADYPRDYVDLTIDRDSSELKEIIREYDSLAYYDSCGHHPAKRASAMTAKAAEQGYMNFLQPIEENV